MERESGYERSDQMARVKYLSAKKFNLYDNFPNFMASCSIKGMKNLYGPRCLLVRQGSYIYNVESKPHI